MRWYLPTWNGDIRAESTDSGTKLTIIEPTPRELMTLGRLEHQFRAQGWWKSEDSLWRPGERRKQAKRQEVSIDAPLDQIAPLLIENYKPGKQTLTAIVYRDGEVETVDGTEDSTAVAKAARKAVSKNAKKAATVKRATPCCPACVPGSVDAASEVLLDFLDPNEHATWARDRRIVVRGGRTGHRYLIAHRHSPTAVQMGRICFDLDDRTVLHFHDNSIPPEEEVLGAKLVLQHREPWLRNEATLISPSFHLDGTVDRSIDASHVFDNPFGDHLDGVADAGLTQAIGSAIMSFRESFEGNAPAWWFSDLGAAIDQMMGTSLSVEIGESFDDDDGERSWLDADEAEFFESAVQLGKTAPTALAEVLLYWRRRAKGYAAPDWMGA